MKVWWSLIFHLYIIDSERHLRSGLSEFSILQLSEAFTSGGNLQKFNKQSISSNNKLTKKKIIMGFLLWIYFY
jgi:hypothetical protein